MEINNDLPIGVFDSGVGGLTVLNALRTTLPNEDFIYLGDTARVPYGNRTKQTIIRYASSCAQILVQKGVKAIVIACNTASAYALDALQNALAIPVFGVIEPASQMAAQMTKTREIAIIGTRATIASRSYENALHAIDPQINVHSAPCPLLVPIAEEGWADTDIARAVTARYLETLLKNFYDRQASPEKRLDTLILGCTHYPLLKKQIQSVLSQMNEDIRLCDCGIATAAALSKALQKRRALNAKNTPGNASFLVTDAPEQFSQIAQSFMNDTTIRARHIDIS